MEIITDCEAVQDILDKGKDKPATRKIAAECRAGIESTPWKSRSGCKLRRGERKGQDSTTTPYGRFKTEPDAVRGGVRTPGLTYQ